MKIQNVKEGIDKYQKGEDVIVETYANADEAVKALLKRLD